jgi:hypothetical protein
VYSGLGGRVQLECDVDGFPQPVLNWFRLSRLDNRRHLITPDQKHVMASEVQFEQIRNLEIGYQLFFISL